MKRFEFVKGWLTGGTDPADGSVECGAGTFYPIEVTLDQIAEIYYRSRDSYLAGSMTTTYTSSSDPELLAITTSGFTGTPSAALVESGVTSEGETTLSQRAYSTWDVAGFAQYFGNAYSVNYAYWDPLPSFYDAGNYYNVNLDYYDADSELAIHSRSFRINNPTTGLSQDLSATFPEDQIMFNPITMPSFYSAYHEVYRTDGYSPSSGIYIAEASFAVNGEIAWIDDNASGNPLDPLNRKFIGFYFYIRPRFIYGGSEPVYSTFYGAYGADATTPINFNIELSTSTLSCPLYAGGGNYFSFDGITHSGEINLVVNKWFPYQDSGGNVWSPTTGAKL